MIRNIQALMDKSKNFANKNHISVQEVLQNYMFERLVDRWNKYRKEHEYAKKIEYNYAIDAIKKIYNIL